MSNATPDQRQADTRKQGIKLCVIAAFAVVLAATLVVHNWPSEPSTGQVRVKGPLADGIVIHRLTKAPALRLDAGQAKQGITLPTGHYQLQLRPARSHHQTLQLHVPADLTVVLNLPTRPQPYSRKALWRLANPVGRMTAVADLSQDGVRDLLVARGDGELLALSGNDGSVLWSCEVPGVIVGWYSEADFDQDGYHDVRLDVRHDHRLHLPHNINVHGFWKPTPSADGSIKISGQTGQVIERLPFSKVPKSERQDASDWQIVPQKYAAVVERFCLTHTGRDGTLRHRGSSTRPVFHLIESTETSELAAIQINIWAKHERLSELQGRTICVVDLKTANCLWRSDVGFARSITYLGHPKSRSPMPPRIWFDNACVVTRPTNDDGDFIDEDG